VIETLGLASIGPRRSMPNRFPINLLAFALGLSAALVGCDKTSAACFEDKSLPVKQRISACGELCDKDDAKACDQQAEIAVEHCMQKGDAEVCRWMCDFAKVGKDLYCKKHESLGGG
jgi:hypothetical protein